MCYAVVWQHVIGMVCVLCGGVAACHRYGVCTVRWCGSMSQEWCVYCVVVWQHVIGMVCVLCDGVGACHRYGVCTVRLCGSMS